MKEQAKAKAVTEAVSVVNKPVVELHYKLVKRGNKWMAFSKSLGEWTPLLPDYTLASSAIGVIEAQITKDIYKGDI